ncbi:hypothetical protein ITJ86_01190 [Winogradskyella sp. F6397]|uniref:DUF4595 domain-containing protein n=1 Tax=Winogradskyella marina TaxID=2785530 RepID=A0ABS0EDI5_9FLAO|nr:hypothetical protein [Winogradskyella marina]MBF8148490.1 hypothetical protein [Winogradskyella marina]
MKKSVLIIILFALISFSCSNESINEPEMPENELTNYIYKTYNVSNTPNTVIDSTNYQIDNDRITSSSGLNLETLTQLTSNYNYANNRINEIQSFSNGLLTRIQSFTYNDGDLVEYLSESINSQGQSSSFQKHVFTHTTDTIFSSWTQSDDGVNFDINVSDFKIVIDGNDNRTYFEAYDYFNDEIKFEISTYNANSSIINESKYMRLDNGNDVLSFENNYTSTSSENLFNRINEATFTRRNLMLLYHLQPNAVNNINAKNISKNALMTFESSFGNSFADFEILNTTDDVNNIILSDFKTVISGNVFTRFSQEFIFN